MTETERRVSQRRIALWALAAALTAAAVALSMPPLRRLIEQSMAWHMVVQMPLLMLAGWVFAQAASTRRTRPNVSNALAAWNQFGLTGGLTVLVLLAYWMLPSSIDRALVVPTADAFKVASLWLGGALLKHSGQRAPLMVQLFFVGTALPMLVWAGLYFANTDLRLCNAYSLSSQIAAGQSLATLAVLLAVCWGARAMSLMRSSSN
jgi:hypothetical protein